jgi:ribosomal protein L11 methyltransferase
VLAIAAAKLGFEPVFAVDVDAQAAEATARNAEANGVAVDACVADALSGELPPVEVAVVNVALDLDRPIADRLDCARLITSGYLASETPNFDGFRREARREADGWAADLHFRTK